MGRAVVLLIYTLRDVQLIETKYFVTTATLKSHWSYRGTSHSSTVGGSMRLRIWE